MGIWRLGRCAIYLFYGPDGPKVQKWAPELFIHLGGAIGRQMCRIARPRPHTQVLLQAMHCNWLHMAQNELMLKLHEAVCIRMVSRPNWTQTKDMEIVWASIPRGRGGESVHGFSHQIGKIGK